jgi:hypothetical protein
MDEFNSASFEADLLHCANDFVYFCEKYIKIVHPTRGLVPFLLHEYQKRYAAFIGSNQYVIGKKFRQGGFTTLNMAWLVWRFIFKLDERNLVICKTDREALSCSYVFRGMLKHIPEAFFKEEDRGKFNDHTVENQTTNTIVQFRAARATCGIAVTNLFIEEAAFIGDMDQHWKAMWPALSTHGKCVVMSTVNGKGNWFHETYTDAENSANSVAVFRCDYWEHPDYNNCEWIEMVKTNLGERGWEQEILGEFRDVPVVDEPVAAAEEAQCFKAAAEEKAKEVECFKFVNSLAEERQFLRDRRIEAVKSNPHGVAGGQLGGIRHNTAPPKLLHDKDTEKSACNITFDTVDRPHTFQSFIWPKGAEDLAEEHIFACEDYSLANSIEKKKQNLKDLEERINSCVLDDQMLVLAGVIGEDEVSDGWETKPSDNRVDEEVLKTVVKLGNFPENLKLSFKDKQFCVNGVPTNIREFDLCCLYSGLVAFTSHDRAVAKIAKLIVKRMTPLFGVRKEG